MTIEVSIYRHAGATLRVKLKGTCLTEQPVTALNTIAEHENIHQCALSHAAGNNLSRNRSQGNAEKVEVAFLM